MVGGFNKAYPIVMRTMLENKEREELFIEYLVYYYDLNNLGYICRDSV